jgi:signal transduction histidine kinase
VLPIERIRRDIAEISLDRLDRRVTVPPEPEYLRRLATTINAMLDRLGRGVDDQRRRTADAVHALRAPLTVVRTELDVTLRSRDLPPSAQEVLASVRDEVDAIGRIADNLLTLAALDEEGMALELVPVDLLEAVAAATQPFRRVASSKRLTLETGGERCRAQADAALLHVALTNLVDNAIKFTEADGEIRVTAWSVGADVGVTVADTGPGISPEARERVFDRFYRGERAVGGGTGLGLAIAREIATALGGRVWVESRAGEGSAFSLALPRSPTSAR